MYCVPWNLQRRPADVIDSHLARGDSFLFLVRTAIFYPKKKGFTCKLILSDVGGPVNVWQFACETLVDYNNRPPPRGLRHYSAHGYFTI